MIVVVLKTFRISFICSLTLVLLLSVGGCNENGESKLDSIPENKKEDIGIDGCELIDPNAVDDITAEDDPA